MPSRTRARTSGMFRKAPVLTAQGSRLIELLLQFLFVHHVPKVKRRSQDVQFIDFHVYLWKIHLGLLRAHLTETTRLTILHSVWKQVLKP
jgi:hypothetical protein